MKRAARSQDIRGRSKDPRRSSQSSLSSQPCTRRKLCCVYGGFALTPGIQYHSPCYAVLCCAVRMLPSSSCQWLSFRAELPTKLWGALVKGSPVGSPESGSGESPTWLSLGQPATGDCQGHATLPERATRGSMRRKSASSDSELGTSEASKRPTSLVQHTSPLSVYRRVSRRTVFVTTLAS